MTSNGFRRYDVAIAGGSLGGLFAAALLHKRGHNVQIFEKSARGLRNRGAGLVAQSDIFATLEAIELPATEVPGVTSTERITLDRAGVIHYRERAEQTQLSWDRLYDALRTAVPDDRYHLDSAVTGVVEVADRALFTTSRGDRDATLLIGADGANSLVRRAVAPESADNRYVGYAIWRGLIPEEAVTSRAADTLFRRMAFYTGPGEHALGYLVPGVHGETTPGGRRYNWVWYRALTASSLSGLMELAGKDPQSMSLAPGHTPTAVVRELGNQAQDRLPPQFASVVAAEPRPFLQGVVDYVAPRLSRGRTVLLGDAAAVVRPHTAMGAAKAAADALHLANELDDRSLDDAIASYARRRLSVARDIARYGVALGAGLPLR